MHILAHANRLRLFNTALGTHETDLSTYPIEYVDAVCDWQRHRENPDGQR